MKPFLIVAALLVSACCVQGGLYGAVSTQYQHLDPHSHSYSYGYADPNSQKHETRSHDGVTKGAYSYLDGHGHVQSISYIADPHHGFHAVGTNLPKGPAPAPLIHDAGHYASGHSYHEPYHGPIAHIALTHTGVPVDTPEVQHAKAAHLAAHAAVSAASHDSHHHLYKRSLYAYNPWTYGGAAHVPLTHGGVPVDTPEVQHAKAAHYAAHAKALAAAGPGHGAPIETPEVQHAKAAHFAAHAAARSGHAHGGPAHSNYDGRWDNHYDGGHYSDAHYGGYKGPIHIPVIHNGVPVEPAEVQHARAAHLSALAAASHGDHSSYHGEHYGGHYGNHY